MVTGAVREPQTGSLDETGTAAHEVRPDWRDERARDEQRGHDEPECCELFGKQRVLAGAGTGPLAARRGGVGRPGPRVRERLDLADRGDKLCPQAAAACRAVLEAAVDHHLLEDLPSVAWIANLAALELHVT